MLACQFIFTSLPVEFGNVVVSHGQFGILLQRLFKFGLRNVIISLAQVTQTKFGIDYRGRFLAFLRLFSGTARHTEHQHNHYC